MKYKLNIYFLSIIAIILMGIIFQNVALWKSAQIYKYGIGYWGPLARDGIWHESLVAELVKHIPPNNPGFAGTKLINYHYFYDLVVAIIVKTSNIDSRFLIYVFFPILFSVLLGIGTYLLAKRLFKNRLAIILTLFLTYFGSSFGWVIDVLRAREIGGESAFWANQPVSMNINPPFAISLIMVIFILLLIDKYIKSPGKLLGLVIGVLSGVLIGFKVYAGIIVIGAVAALCLKKALFDKKYSLIPVLMVSVGVAVLVMAFTGAFSSAGLLEVSPLWLVNTMIDAGDRVGIPSFTAKRFAYQGSGRWIQFIILEVICIFIFIVGNLGTRILSFVSGGWKYFIKDMNFLLLALCAVSLLPVFIFIQKGNPWNIVQFFYYFLFFTALLSGAAIDNFSKFVSKKMLYIFLIIFFVITPISSIATFRSWLYPNPVAYLSKSEMAALEFLQKQDPGIVLKHYFDGSYRDKFKDPYPLAVYADNAYVSAYSRKEVFLEDTEQQIILNTAYQGRLKEMEKFFSDKTTEWSNSFLKSNNISYLYLPKIYSLPAAEREYKMDKIFENEEVNIYKVVQ